MSRSVPLAKILSIEGNFLLENELKGLSGWDVVRLEEGMSSFPQCWDQCSKKEVEVRDIITIKVGPIRELRLQTN